MGPNDRTRTRRLGAALAGAAVGVAGLTGSLLLLGQSAGATTVDEPTEIEHGDLDELDLDQIQAEWAEFDACLVDQGVLTEEDIAQMYSEAWDDADWDEAWDDADWDEAWDDADWDEAFASVAVENGDQLTFVDFGDGDGTVTIEKVGDEITVSSSGDVTQEDVDLAEFEAGFEDDGEYSDFEDSDFDDFEDLDAELQAEIEQWDDAIEACADLAPEDGLVLDGDVMTEGDEYDDYDDAEATDG